MLKIRLMRTGKKKQASYRIIVSEAKSKRDGSYIDLLGYYQAYLKKPLIKLDKEKYLKWQEKGAQATPTVRNLYKKLYGKTA